MTIPDAKLNALNNQFQFMKQDENSISVYYSLIEGLGIAVIGTSYQKKPFSSSDH